MLYLVAKRPMLSAEQWRTGRDGAHLTQVAAARALKVSQAYLSQLENGLRVSSSALARKAAKLYKLPPTVLPLPRPLAAERVLPDDLQRELAALGYPGFEHVRTNAARNPAEVVLRAVVKKDLDTRLVESLPWVLSAYPDMNWAWLRDRAKLQNAQNRLGYLVHLAAQTARTLPGREGAVQTLCRWEDDLEAARLAREGTLCRDSMPDRERSWLRTNRPPAAAHWNLLTSLTAEQLPYAAN
jgi:transcriptional regulator with XRE-family HTH domain